MLKCPLCGFMNEDGALFCEQCKSDLAAGEPVATATPVEPGTAFGDAMPVANAVPVALATPLEAAPVLEAHPVETAPAPPAPAQVAPAPATLGPVVSQGAPIQGQPRLVVVRGLKLNVEYPIYEGQNFIGRTDDKPVDIDLEDQEAEDRVWSSRQHAVINFENGQLSIEDLNSSNGTFVNRTRVYPGQKRPLIANDTVQIGTVQMRVKV